MVHGLLVEPGGSECFAREQAENQGFYQMPVEDGFRSVTALQSKHLMMLLARVDWRKSTVQ